MTSASYNRPAHRTHRTHRTRAGLSAVALVALALLSMVLGGCTQQTAKLISGPPRVPVEIENSFSFRVRDLDFSPLPGARIDLFVGSGQIFGPTSLKVDARGRANVKVRTQVSRQIVDVETTDTLLNFRTAILYRITAPGFLPVWGRSEIEDAWESYRRADFAVRLNRRPQAKKQLITETMIPISSLLAENSTAAKADRQMIIAGLKRLWRSWRAARMVIPSPGLWDLTTRPAGVYLKAGVEPVRPISELTDANLYRIFISDFLPLLRDLEATYGHLVDGWDLTLVAKTQPKDDPYAIPDRKAFRMVVSRKVLEKVQTLPGGFNNLILMSEVCTFDEKEWDPLAHLDKALARRRVVWNWLDPLLAPGSPSE